MILLILYQIKVLKERGEIKLLTNIPILNIIIGFFIASVSVNIARYEFEKHKDKDGEIIKWSVWSAGSISGFISSIAGFIWGCITALISLFHLF